VSDTVDIPPGDATASGFEALESGDLEDLYGSDPASRSPGPGDLPAAAEAAAEAAGEEVAADRPVVAEAAAEMPAPAENGETASESPVADPEGDPSCAPSAPPAAAAVRVELKETGGGRGFLAGVGLPGHRRAWAAGVFAAVLCLGLAWGLRAWYSQPQFENPTAMRFKLHDPQASAVQAPGGDLEAAAPPRDWGAKLEEIDALRQGLTVQWREIQARSRACQTGVLELEEELAVWIRRSGGESLPQALKDKRIDFLLRSIQRRLAYVDAMEKPLNQLDAASEELLYLRRRAALDLQVQAIGDGVNLEPLWRQIQSAIVGVQPVMRELSLDIEGSYPRQPLESIWKRAVETAKNAPPQNMDDRSSAITQEICSGDLTRAAELNRLTLKAARCLAESSVQDLFLNRISELPPNAAQRLREWPGQWLCLNGLKRISPEAARHLFAWPGGCLSLNGVGELPAESARFIPSWGGRQLELVGLQKSNGLEYLIQWEDAGGKLIVSDALRRQIETLRGLAKPQQAGR
jgi:hypothetical protein